MATVNVRSYVRRGASSGTRGASGLRVRRVVKTVTTTLGMTYEKHYEEAQGVLNSLRALVGSVRRSVASGRLSAAVEDLRRGYVYTGIVMSHGNSIEDGSGRGGELHQEARDLREDLDRLDKEVREAGRQSPKKQVEGLKQGARLGLLHGEPQRRILPTGTDRRAVERFNSIQRRLPRGWLLRRERGLWLATAPYGDTAAGRTGGELLRNVRGLTVDW